jgi:hypothetical protein
VVIDDADRVVLNVRVAFDAHAREVFARAAELEPRYKDQEVARDALLRTIEWYDAHFSTRHIEIQDHNHAAHEGVNKWVCCLACMEVVDSFYSGYASSCAAKAAGMDSLARRCLNACDVLETRMCRLDDCEAH